MAQPAISAAASRTSCARFFIDNLTTGSPRILAFCFIFATVRQMGQGSSDWPLATVAKTATDDLGEYLVRTLKENDVRLVTYVPDNVLRPLIDSAAADNYFMLIGATREDEAVGTLAGAYMGGLRDVATMQTSGFALIANARTRTETSIKTG